MSAKPSTFAAQVEAVLTPEARRVLPRLAARSARRSVPLEALCPLTRSAYGALTGNERRAHLDRLALRLVAVCGSEAASVMIVEYVAESVRAGGPSDPIEALSATTQASSRSAAPTEAAPRGYVLPCALGCGQTRPTGSPLAQVWRCDAHPRPKHSRPRRIEVEA